MKSTLKITSKGQVTCPEEGAGSARRRAGRPDHRASWSAPARVEVRPARPGAALTDFVGCLKKADARKLTLAEIDEDRPSGLGRRTIEDRRRHQRSGARGVMDDRAQGALAARALLEAEAVAVTLPCLCEFVWVLMRGYGRSCAEVAAAIRKLIAGASVLVDRPAVAAGLAILDRGGDFADGVIAFEGRRLGGRVLRASTERRWAWSRQLAARRALLSKR